MSDIKLQKFRGFLTERFTAVAVEIFGEFETIVEAYYEENKHLRNVLHMVLSPEIKIPKIDANHYTGAATDVTDPPPELNTRVDLGISEPLPKKPKEEQTEYDISWGSGQQQQGPGEVDNFIPPDCVKNDPKEEEEEAVDTSMPYIEDSFHIKVVESNPDSSATVSADEDEFSSTSDSDAGVTVVPRPSRNKESTSQTSEHHKHETKSANSLKTPVSPLQKTMLELPRRVPYQSFIPSPSECKSFLARLTEAFKDYPEDKKPLITKMGLTENVEYVDCAFGKVPKGCPLSYQHPVPSARDHIIYDNAPSRPPLPLRHHELGPMSSFPTLSVKEQEHVDVMQITWEAAHSLEQSTRGRKEVVQDLRKLRLTSRFREICKLKPGQSNAEYLIYKIQKGTRRCKTEQIEEEMKADAFREYCQHLCVNWSPCGLVVHPEAPWLGALPDGLVYDPSETHSYGLMHVKCIALRSFIECKFLFCQDGVMQLKRSHSYYWHIQGEMMVTGMEWCDLLVFSREHMLIQRIYRDKAIIKAMKKKLDEFFFRYYLPSLL
ncbi:uncharacterized protein LOC125893527 isoform X2 [Epinephelus fuscoguttatus]|uniref:uncharacterized protein LOC125893527 isoform X2 n=1 Tax=Epinephelus fuscoguttatus TaxID=293821 RepID=UPI0020D1EAAA|nr:uncharacterized protein LOC125893527 isoform X2 [Epinephelus fuscoguttatus]